MSCIDSKNRWWRVRALEVLELKPDAGGQRPVSVQQFPVCHLSPRTQKHLVSWCGTCGELLTGHLLGLRKKEKPPCYGSRWDCVYFKRWGSSFFVILQWPWEPIWIELHVLCLWAWSLNSAFFLLQSANFHPRFQILNHSDVCMYRVMSTMSEMLSSRKWVNHSWLLLEVCVL